tara:strand:- start:29 stop:307 length:279 start_codon:yes stop_codon:yes gene_type:complete
MKTNGQVIQAWSNGQKAKSGRLKTDGDKLWSYSLCIGRSDCEGGKVIFDYTAGGGSYASQTTSTHVNLAKRLTPKGSCTIMRPDVASHAGLI